MISYTLKCENDHRFDSWFQSASAFDKLLSAGMVTCPSCASGAVEKAIMAPRVRTARKSTSAAEQGAGQAAERATENTSEQTSETSLTTPTTDQERAIAELKSKVEASSEYVGMEFASQARAIHEGDAPERPIYGEAAPEEALKLLQDGVPVAPLPFMPKRKTN